MQKPNFLSFFPLEDVFYIIGRGPLAWNAQAPGWMTEGRYQSKSDQQILN